MIPSTLDPDGETRYGDFDAFYATERRRLFLTLVLVTKDRQGADDLTQEAFVRVLERWDRVSSMDSAVGYLYRVAFNLHRSRVRGALRWARRVLTEQPEVDVADEVTARVSVRRALADLTEEQRAAVVLVDLTAFTADEAAGVLGIDAAAVRARVYRARQRLREELSDDG